MSFLKALYQDSSCRVKVQDRLSEEFGVGMGLRQGCVLSPLLFSLYINGVVTRMRDEKCGVQCGGDMIPGLLFTDDTSLVASDKEQIEMGRWHGLKKEERVCKCDSGEVEDVCHWLLQCSAWNSLRQPLLEAMDNEGEEDGDRPALILSHACINYRILSIITFMWSARF